MKIYPEVEVTDKGRKTFLRTKLVKKHKKRYYYWNISYSFPKNENKEETIKHINKFHMLVYNTIILGKVDPTMICREPLFEVAHQQISEKERLTSIIKKETESWISDNFKKNREQ